MVDKRPKMSLPFILYQFIDERQFQRICVKIHLLSSTKSETIKATISPCGMILCVDCRYQSSFIDAERHRESFQEPSSRPFFSNTDVRMVAFAHASSQLARTDGRVWGRMSIALPLQVETDFYSEDVIPGYDLFRCDDGFFLHIQLVGVERVKAKLVEPLPGIRVVPSRSSSSDYDSPLDASDPRERTVPAQHPSLQDLFEARLVAEAKKERMAREARLRHQHHHVDQFAKSFANKRSYDEQNIAKKTSKNNLHNSVSAPIYKVAKHPPRQYQYEIPEKPDPKQVGFSRAGNPVYGPNPTKDLLDLNSPQKKKSQQLLSRRVCCG